MLFKLLGIIKGLLNNMTLVMIILVGLFTLLIDGKRYKRKGHIRDFKIIRIISYSYMAIGGLMYILLLFI